MIQVWTERFLLWHLTPHPGPVHGDRMIFGHPNATGFAALLAVVVRMVSVRAVADDL